MSEHQLPAVSLPHWQSQRTLLQSLHDSQVRVSIDQGKGSVNTVGAERHGERGSKPSAGGDLTMANYAGSR